MPISNIGPIASFANNAQAARFWALMTAIMFLCWMGDRYFVTDAFKRKSKVVIMTPANEFMAAEELDFEQADSLQQYLVTLCTITYYQRTPSGLAFPELFRRAYINPIRDVLNNSLPLEKKFFAENQVTQTPEIINYQTVVSGDNKMTIVADIQLKWSGVVSDRQVAMDPAFKRVEYTFSINPEMRNAGYFPMACYQLKEEDLPPPVQPDAR